MLQTFVANLLNVILISTGGIGLIFRQAPGAPATTPAIEIQDSSKREKFNVDVSGNLRSSGSVAVRGTVTTFAYPSCTALETNTQGQLVCGSDDGLATSTGSLKVYFDGLYFRSSTGSLKASFGQQFVQSSTGALKALFDSLYFRSSTGSLRLDLSKRFVLKQGDTMTGALKVRANLSGSTLNVDVLQACTNLTTNAAGRLACNNAVYAATSTGSLKALFDSLYFRSSTGSLKTLFDALYFRSSTGSLKTFFDQQYLRTSTGSLKVLFDSLYYRTSTGALQASLDKRFVNTSGDTMTGALKVRANVSGSTLNVDNLRNCDTIDTDASGRLACGTDSTAASGLDQATADARFVNTSGDTMTGALKVRANFSGSSLNVDALQLCTNLSTNAAGRAACNNAVYAATSTGSLKALFDSLYFRSSTGSLRTLFDGLYFRSSTGSLKILFDANYFRSSTGSLKTFFDAQYLRTSTGALKVLFDANYLRTSTGSLRFDFSKRFVLKQGDTMTGALKVQANLSGRTLNVDNLQNCDTIDTDAAGRLSCGTDATGGGGTGAFTSTGSLETYFNRRHVGVPGDTMTGGLLIVNGGAGTQTIDANVLLEVAGTMSGANVHAQNGVTSSGAMTWEGSASGASLWVSKLQPSGLTDCDASTSKVLWDLTSLRFTCGTDLDTQSLFQTITVAGQSDVVADNATDTLTLVAGTNVTITNNAGTDAITVNATDTNTTYSPGQGLLLNGTVFSLNTTVTGSLVRVPTVSGSLVFAKTTLASSGALVVNNGVTFKNLTSCTDLQTSSNGALSCNNAVYLATSTGSLKSSFDSLYFRSSTGSLKTFFDGQYLRTSTGSLKVFFDANYLRTSTGSLKTFFDANYFRTSTGALKTLFDGNYFRTSSGALKTYFDKLYVKRGGATMTGGLLIVNGGAGTASVDANVLLEVSGTASGFNLHAQTGLSSSGALTWEGSATGASLWVSKFDGAGLTNCTGATTEKLLWDSTAKRFSCGSDNATGTGLSQALADARYVKKQGDTMTGGLLIQNGGTPGTIDAGLLLEIAGTASGRLIRATDALASSGTLSIKKRIGSSTGTIFSVDTDGLSYDATNRRFGVGTNSPSYDFHVKTRTGGGDTQVAVEDPDTGGSNGVYFRLISGGSTPNAGFLFNSGGTQYWSVQFNNSNSNPNLQISRDSGAGDLFLADDGGNVGIAKTNVKALLDVAGTMSGQGLVVGGGQTMTRVYSASATMDFGATTSATCSTDITVTVGGAALGDVCSVGAPNASLVATGQFTCWVSAADTVSVRHCTNGTTGNPASGTFRVMVTHF